MHGRLDGGVCLPLWAPKANCPTHTLPTENVIEKVVDRVVQMVIMTNANRVDLSEIGL